MTGRRLVAGSHVCVGPPGRPGAAGQVPPSAATDLGRVAIDDRPPVAASIRAPSALEHDRPPQPTTTSQTEQTQHPNARTAETVRVAFGPAGTQVVSLGLPGMLAAREAYPAPRGERATMVRAPQRC